MDCPAWLTTATDRAGEELSSNWRSPNTELNLLRGLSPPFLEESAREKLRIALPPKWLQSCSVLFCTRLPAWSVNMWLVTVSAVSAVSPPATLLQEE